METNIIPADGTEPIARVHVLSITIHTFKGRKNVEAHLFRHTQEASEADTYDWDSLIGAQMDPEHPGTPEDAKKMLLEAFTQEERDSIIDYLSKRYEGKLSSITACPMELPVALGVTPLSAIPEGKTMGFIRFDDANNYPLPFAFRGFYDLAQHDPIVQKNGEG